MEVIAKLDTDLPSVVHLQEHWLAMPGMSLIVANAFDRPVFVFSNDKKNGEQVSLNLPYFTPPNSSPPIFLGYIPSHLHFVSLSVDWQRSGFPSGALCRFWKKNRAPRAAGWETWCPGRPDYPEKKYTKEEREKLQCPVRLSDDDDDNNNIN